MKFILLIVLGLNLMAQEKIPYPYPNYDTDLMAKEIINGTYMASIKMMIRNSQTGEERYVFVPDSPIIEDMQVAKEIKEIKVEGIDSNITIYDRNKSLEDAVLPVYVDIPDKEPLIVSRAMCPQGLTYVTTTDDTYGFLIARFDDGTDDFFVGVDKTDDGSSSTNTDGDIYTFFKHVGATKTKMFDVNVDDIGTPHWLYATHKRNFFYAGGKLYEYNESGFSVAFTSELAKTKPIDNIMAAEGDNIYLLSFHDMLRAENIITGEILELDTQQSISSNSIYYISAYSEAYFGGNSSWFYIKNGILHDNLKPKKYHKATMKVRFDYHNENKPANYNFSKGVDDAPRTRRPSSSSFLLLDEYIGIKEGYVAVSAKTIYFTKDYKKYINSGISADSASSIIITKNYMYFYRSGKFVIVSVDGWSYKLPDGRYAELFLKNKLADRFYDMPYIGD